MLLTFGVLPSRIFFLCNNFTWLKSNIYLIVTIVDTETLINVIGKLVVEEQDDDSTVTTVGDLLASEIFLNKT